MRNKSDKKRNISTIIKDSMANIVIGAFVFLALIGLVVNCISIFEMVNNSLGIETEVAAERIEWAITSYKNIAEDIGTIPELSDPEVSVERKTEILENKSEEYGLIRCKIVNPDGKSDMDSQFRGDREYFKKAMKGETCIVDPIVAKTDGELVVIVAAPVWEKGLYGGNIAGVVFCSIDPELLSHIVSDMEITKNTEAYVLSDTGTVVASTNLADVAAQVNHIEKAKEDQYYQRIAHIDEVAISGEDGVVTVWQGAFGANAYGLHSLKGTPNWHLVIHSPIRDYMGPMWISLGIYITIVVITLIVLNHRTHRIAHEIGNPFKEIADRLKKAAEGDLSTEVLTFGDTEEIKIISNAARDLVNRLDYMTTDDAEFDSSLSLKNLLGATALKSIQDMVMSATGLGIIIVDAEGNQVATSTNATRFCGELTKGSLIGREHCESCDRKAAMECIEKGRCISYNCHAGLKEYAAPIMMDGHYIGAILGGQIREDDVDEESIRSLAVEYDINPDDYVAAAKQIRVWSKEETDRVEEVLDSAIKLLSDMARQTYKQNIKQRKQEKRAVLQTVNGKSVENSMASIVKNIAGANSLDVLKPDASYVAKTLISGASDKLFESVYSPRETVKEAIGDMELRTKGRNVDFLLDIKDNLPEKLMGDEDKVSNITNRMVQVAISSTDVGYIRMDVSSLKNGYVTYLKLKLRYSGGNKDAIDTERMRRFFDRRNSFSMENHNAQEIGLITLSNVIYEVNGKIQIKENKGQGVTMCVVIPQLEATNKTY